jgi:hypothetical protein
LCEVPGTGPCATKAIDVFGAGGKVALPLVKESTKDNGIIFGNNGTQGGTTTSSLSTTTGKRTITVERCVDFQEREITDLPTFGPCVRVRVEPAITGRLNTAALVYSCDVTAESVNTPAKVVDIDQAERITLHRLVGNKLEALPHDHPQCGVSTSSTESVRGMLVDLSHGRLRSAARQFATLLAPKPLYAAMFIDQGGGGFTFLEEEGVGRSISAIGGARMDVTSVAPTFHEFQFLLPAKFDFVYTPTNLAQYPADVLTVSVKVTDLGDAPVMNARVRFSADQGLLNRPVAFTSSDEGSRGLATVAWTMAASSTTTLTPPSPSTLTVTGRGIGGELKHGPRNATATKVDPFQPCGDAWDADSPLTCSASRAPVVVGMGTMYVKAITVGDVAGQLINEQTGAPISGSVSYSVRVQTTPEVTLSSSVTVAEDGVIRIKDHTPGTSGGPFAYPLTFTATNFETRTRTVAIVPKQTTPLDYVCLTPVPGSISGTLVSSFDGAPVTNAMVVTATETTPRIAAQCLPDGAPAPTAKVVSVATSNGNFTIAGLPPGNYSLSITPDETKPPVGYFDKAVGAVVSAGSTTTQPPISLVPFVTATASVDQASFTGACGNGHLFTFTGAITSAVAGPVTVSYRWPRSDGATTDHSETITFDAPGTKYVTDTWSLNPASFSGWEQVQLESPTKAVSNKANFTLTCTDK